MAESPPLPAQPAEIHFAISQKAAAILGGWVEGNGLKAQQVRLARHDTTVHQIPGILRAELKPEIVRSQIKGRQPQGLVLDSAAAVMSHSAGDAAALLNDRSVQQEILQATGKLAGQGFAMKPQTLALHAGKKDFSVIDKCLKCNGATFLPCGPCNATGKVPCAPCSGQGFVSCPACFGAGQVQQGDGGRAVCLQCQGAGKVQCLACQGGKMQPCAACRGEAKIGCTECGQSGFSTHLYRAACKALLSFELDRRQIAPDVQQIIDRLGVERLATEGHVEILRQPPVVTGNHIVIPFTALLPVARAEFTIEGRSCPATVAGLQGRILQIDPVLDSLVKPGIKALQSLSKGPLASQALIDTACKYRLIRESLAGLARRPKKAVHQKLVRDYPLVLSPKYANATIHYANIALQSIAAGPRNKGLLAGTALGALLSAGYYLTPARAGILEMMLQKNIGQHIVVPDVAVWLLGWTAAVFVIKSMAAQAFGKLLPGNLRAQALPAAGRQGLWALPATGAAWLLTAALAAAKPEWLLLALKALGVHA